MNKPKNSSDLTEFIEKSSSGGNQPLDQRLEVINANKNSAIEQLKLQSDIRKDEANHLATLRAIEADKQELRRLEAERANSSWLTDISGPLPVNRRERAAVMAQRQAARWTTAKENYYRTLRNRVGLASPEGEAAKMRHDRANEIYKESEYIHTDPNGHWKRYWDSVNAKRNALTESQKAKDALWDRRLETVFGSDYVTGLQKTPGAAKQAREDLMKVSKYYHENAEGLGDLINAYVHSSSNRPLDSIGEDAKRIVETAVPKLFVKDAKGIPTSYNKDARTDMDAVEKLSPKDKYTLTKAIMQFHRENPQALHDWQQLSNKKLSTAQLAVKEEEGRRKLELAYGKNWRERFNTPAKEAFAVGGLRRVEKFYENNKSSLENMIMDMAHDSSFRPGLAEGTLSTLLPGYYMPSSAANPEQAQRSKRSVNPKATVSMDAFRKKLSRPQKIAVVASIMKHQQDVAARKQKAKSKAKP